MAPENLPRISIVTPVFNGIKYLRQTLASVRAQNYGNLEYIVCDGGSTDGSLALLEENRDLITHLFVGKDKGMYDALAKGFRQATGEICGWINSDDMLMPWCLSALAEAFRRIPGCQWVTGIPAIMDEKGRVLWIASVAPYYRRSWIRRRYYSIFGLGVIQQESTFFSRALFEKCGGLDTSLRMAGDFNLWCRFAETAELHQLGTVMAAFRLHDSNLSSDDGFYFKESRAVRIPAGRIIGYTNSFLTFLYQRWKHTPRLADLLVNLRG